MTSLESDPRETDRVLMRLALRAARRGRPSPNPHVGAVVALGRDVVSVGHHHRAGEAHAEVAAIRSAGRLAHGATLYVTMAPCNHHGRTAPCTEAIVDAGIKRVVFAAADPKPHVAGGVDRLREAGIEVEEGVLREEATRLIRDFSKHILTSKPWVTLKAAVTLDGRIATRASSSKWITSERSRRLAHKIRDASDAILVGIETVIADDPALTVRYGFGGKPTRVVLDSQLRTPLNSAVLRGDESSRVVIFHAGGASVERADALRVSGAELVPVANDDAGKLSLEAVLHELSRRDVVRLLVEGGSGVHSSFLAGGHADEIAVFMAPKVLGDPDAKPLAAFRALDQMSGALELAHVRVTNIGTDVLIRGDVRKD